MVLGICSALLYIAGAVSGADGVHDDPQWAPDVFGGYPSTHVLLRTKPGVRVVALDDGSVAFQLVELNKPQPLNGRMIDAPADAPQAAQLTAVLQQWNVTGIEPVYQFPIRNRALFERHGLNRDFRLLVPPGTDTPPMVAALSAFDAYFEFVELDSIGGVAETLPNDAFFDVQYSLHNTGQTVGGVAGVVNADINATDAWDYTTGDSSLILAVLDSGVNEHPDLAGKLIPGWNVVNNTSDTSDSCNHGTHVTGSAAANTNNVIGIGGVCWDVKVMPVRMLNGCFGSESDLAAGIWWAIDHDADVINMSLQFSGGSATLHNAVLAASEADVPMLAAVGNFPFNGGEVAWPAKWPETVAVGATTNLDEPWSGSNTGPELIVAAPGKDIYSLSNSGGYFYNSGTSMATPHVSGLVCLMLSIDPTLTNLEIHELLIATANDIHTEGFDESSGYGRIDALEAVVETQNQTTIPGDVNGDGIVNPADLAIILGNWGPCPLGPPGPPPPECEGDLNFDGEVGPADLAIVLGNWS